MNCFGRIMLLGIAAACCGCLGEDSPAAKPPPPATQPPAAQATSPATTRSASTPAPTPAPTPTRPRSPIDAITDKDVDSITYDDVPPDQGFVTPLVENLDHMDEDSQKRLEDWIARLDDWAGARDENTPQRVRNLLSVASLADLGRGEFEGETAYMIFEKLRSEVDKDVLIKSCAWIILHPEEGATPTRIPELGWEDEMDEFMVRERVPLYAKKLLARLLGKMQQQ